MNQSDFFCHARRSVAEMLKEAAGYLPPGYQILIKEAYRPLSQQKKSFEMVYQDYPILRIIRRCILTEAMRRYIR